MIELPESLALSRQFNQTIIGKTIQSVTANTSPHKFAFFYGDPAEYNSHLTGKRLGPAKTHAGYLEIAAEEYRILFWDGVNLRYLEPGVEFPAKHQLVLAFDDGSHLVCTVQMYGGLYAYRDGENGNQYYLAATSRPTPYEEAFDEAYFAGLRVGLKPSMSVKAFLATEQRIPGLGNGVLQDILFHARLHPKRKLDSLSSQEFHHLYQSVKDTLREMERLGGRDTEKDLFGCPGGYRTVLSAKTCRSPCPVCGGEIVRQAYLGGNVYFCPHCQPLQP